MHYSFLFQFSFDRNEFSSDQVIKPINLEALTKWTKSLPSDIKKEIKTLAPMLERLGYDSQSDMPSYGVAEEFVVNNTNKMKRNAIYWNVKAKFYTRDSSVISFLEGVVQGFQMVFLLPVYLKQLLF